MDFSSEVLDATRGRLLARVELWWERLPETLTDLAERWELTVGDPVGRGNTSLVMRRLTVDGRPAVLKLTPDAELAGPEASALKSWAPSGRVPLVWGYDAALGALLLEAIPNETPLSERRTAVGLDDIAALIEALHRSGAPVLTKGVIALADRVDFIFRHWIERHARLPEAAISAVPLAHLQRGHELARALTTTAAAPVLRHGDLPPGNVLDGGAARGLVAPWTRVRASAMPPSTPWTGVFWGAEDPSTWEPPSRELASALGVDHRRLWEWCAAFAALLAAGTASRRGRPDSVAALLALAP